MGKNYRGIGALLLLGALEWTLSSLLFWHRPCLSIVMSYDNKKIKVPRFNEASGFYTTEQRSRTMSKIRGKNTKPELAFRKALWQKGYRYRVDYRKLIGRPDIVLKKYKTIVFIDGEFWHGYNWEERQEKIKSNRGFWIPKIERNMQRDREVNEALRAQGYTVFRFWSQQLKKDLEGCLLEVVQHLEEQKSKL